MDSESQAADRVGSRIAGKYQLLRLLGSGGMGAVYEAEHAFTKRRVAVKLMHPTFARSGMAAERFLREAQAPSTIGHPGIVEVLDGGHDHDGSLYLVLELLQGETLSDALKRGRPALPWLCAVIGELLDALQAAHAAGFVHRDIKPENVFLLPTDDELPLVKLLDFGVAGLLSTESEKPNLTRAGAILGTPLYMSPEQALGRRVDGRSDLWAVGAILYQAITGKPPFGGRGVQALIVSISTEEHLPLSVASPGLPLRLVKVVEKALQKDPEQRWQSAADMNEALQQALASGPRSVGDGAAARARRADQDAQAKLGRVAIAVVIVLAAIAVSAFILMRPRRDGFHAELSEDDGRSAAAAASPDAVPSRAGSARLATAGAAAGTLVVSAGAGGAKSSTIGATAGGGGAPQAATATASTAAAGSPAPAGAGGHPSPAVASKPEPPASSAERAPRGLDAAQLSAELSRHDAALQRCHQDIVVAALRENPSATNAPELGVLNLDLTLQVAASGRVRSVEVHGDGPESLSRCVADVARGFEFGELDRDSEARIPIVFTPNILRK